MECGYFPESYVLPPCFSVSKFPAFGNRFTSLDNKKFTPPVCQLCEAHFPKSDFTDRTFGIIDPQIHSDIASEVAENWGQILDVIFKPNKKIYAYSFPIPLTSSSPGKIGSLRAGRMIYEWIEMAENDLVEEAYQYKYLVRTDVKNFYPSVYTHSISWALHSRPTIRKGSNRYDFAFLGNRLDKLFQNANDGCTNGLPIGPVVSDLIGEIILSAVDSGISAELAQKDVLGVRFKDDYRFLCRRNDDCRAVTKLLQKGLKEFQLLLNEEKTEVSELPEGIFREWVSRYNLICPKKGTRLSFKEFKEFFLGVLRIDREVPNTGVIDRFIADITDKKYMPLFPVTITDANKIVSLLLLLADKRVKSFPRVLGLLESMMVSAKSSNVSSTIEDHLNKLLARVVKDTDSNRYVISWILYFLKSNRLAVDYNGTFSDPVLESIRTNRMKFFGSAKDFRLFQGVRKARDSGLLLKHLDVFSPQ